MGGLNGKRKSGRLENRHHAASNDGSFAREISQEDLLDLLYLSRLAAQARDKWEAKRDWIKAALRAGAGVQDGVFTAGVVKRSREGREYETLVVR